MYRQEDSWPPALGSPGRGGGRPRRRARRPDRQAPPDLRHGPAQPRERRRRSRATTSLVVLSGDDTFTSGPLTGVFPAGAVPVAVAAVLVHRARHRRAARRRGRPVGLRLRHARRDELLRRAARARGPWSPATSSRCRRTSPPARTRTAREIKAADSAIPLPPTNGSWQRDLRIADPDRHRRPAVGARVLERHQQRVPVRPRRGHRLRQAARHGQRRLHRRLRAAVGRAAQSLDTPNFRSTNGRVWKMVLDPNDPTVVTSLTVFVEGDDNPVKTLDRGPPAGQHRDDARPGSS